MEQDLNGLDAVIEGIESDAIQGLGATRRAANKQKIAAVVGNLKTNISHSVKSSKLVNRRFQIISKTVTTENTVISLSENIKQEFIEVVGIFAVVDNEAVRKATTIRLNHKGIEILPDGFDLNLLTDRENVSMDDYTFPVKLEGNTALVTGSLSVGDMGGTLTEPATIKLYFVCRDDKTFER